MKGSDIFCASQAATSICLSMEQPSSSSSSSSLTIQLGLGSDRAIDRYNPIIKDSRRIGKSLPPCTSQPPPISPKPRKKHHKKNLKNSSEENNEEEKKKFIKPNDQKLKSSYSDTNDNSFSIRKSWSCTRPGDFISPAGSTRYLLSDKTFLAGLSDSDPGLKLAPVEQSKLSQAMKTDELSDSKPPSSSPSPEEVVVLKVSLDCRGCEKKLRKHLSKMEGVTSFNIDFAARKVTVIGNVTELGVLSSISKLKNAKSWSPALLDSGTSQLKNDYRGVGAS
ncbi:Chloroplast-targeted copper chaperone protein [Abeliophyllum distichum]|uniref:Chloroplast-targeted copper chaperone protein n=1 Tax=Abeliophyllum distichum TaxID=126358 RepID=A0ABD1QZ91_9LAMI